jgi:hypothetical protein
LKAGTQRGICTAVFITALFTVVKDGSNPSKYQQMNGLKKKVTRIYNGFFVTEFHYGEFQVGL